MIPSPDAGQVAGADLPHALWRKSSHSNDGGSCVEAATYGRAHLARDSKNPDGPVLAFSRPAWDTFLNRVKAGDFDSA
jgi:uncharacterized protein DUF397